MIPTGTVNTAKADQEFKLAANGIFCTATLGSGNTQTSNILFEVDNMAKTNITYKDVNGKGAEYVVTITINSNDKTKYPDYKIVQKFYVKNDETEFAFNPNFYSEAQGMSITKGKLVNNTWKLEMNISEVFAMVNGKNIYQYFNTVDQNATSIVFSLVTTPAQTGLKYTPVTDNGVIELTEALSSASKLAHMQYTLTHVNSEKIDYDFDILFKNPFVAGVSQTVTLKANAIPGAQTVATAPQVVVNDVNGLAIYNWVAANSALELTADAKKYYKVAAPTVKYEFVKDADYNQFVGNLDPKAVFEIDPNSGVVTYDNLGGELFPSYGLTVKATVTFANLSVVECKIPFSVVGSN